MTFNPRYGYATLALLLIEIAIAVFLDDAIIRPFVGDILVVILIYCFIRMLWLIPVWITIVSVLTFAFVIEYLQHLNLLTRLGWQDHALLRVILGTTFDWKDILAYCLGMAIVLAWESRPKPRPYRRLDR